MLQLKQLILIFYAFLNFKNITFFIKIKYKGMITLNFIFPKTTKLFYYCKVFIKYILDNLKNYCIIAP
ncbi:MAG: hypothetical protein A2046_16095 [Bacteroidetes bacterium GWA2_30_7]|nr:MAG: hypothetical protein A2046_16095 [Bacteroidetes bacterium GWA2_30_7]